MDSNQPAFVERRTGQYWHGMTPCPTRRKIDQNNLWQAQQWDAPQARQQPNIWSKPKKVYIMGSMHNPVVEEISGMVRAMGFEVFDDWKSPGEDADKFWQEYEQRRGRSYVEALRGHHCWNVFNFDHAHLVQANLCVLVMPAGKSAFAEMGFMNGTGKPIYVYMPDEPEKWDIMLRFATEIVNNLDDLLDLLSKHK